jgi:signal transduction histidine kinase
VTDRPDSRWYQRLSLRTRMLFISSAAVAIVMAVGGILLLSLLRAELIDTADDAGEDTADSVAELARAGTLPPVLAATEEVATAVQVVQAGEVISATSNAVGSRTFLRSELRPGVERIYDRRFLPFDEDGPFRVVAVGTETPTGDATVIVAVDVEDVQEVISVASQMGTAGLAALIIILAGVFWVVIGRTLAPVSAIRDRAEAITGSGLHQRVPEPLRHDEIADLARTINAMLARLEDSAKRQEAFVADAAHELRSPIASLQARLETALLNSEADRDDVLTRDLLRETTRMGRLVDHLLLLARSDAGTISIEKMPVDLEEVVRESVASVDTSAVPITANAVEPVQVLGQAALLEHVVTNLLDNAGRYAESSIDVSLHANSTKAILTVDDDGPGIPEHLRRSVLERWVRVDESRERGTGGAGLGLAIVSEIVHVHEGEIEITESPTGGARVQVLLPMS